ncbi:unnamed protein product, partial [Iphiclides podalirius]
MDICITQIFTIDSNPMRSKLPSVAYGRCICWVFVLKAVLFVPDAMGKWCPSRREWSSPPDVARRVYSSVFLGSPGEYPDKKAIKLAPNPARSAENHAGRRAAADSHVYSLTIRRKRRLDTFPSIMTVFKCTYNLLWANKMHDSQLNNLEDILGAAIMAETGSLGEIGSEKNERTELEHSANDTAPPSTGAAATHGRVISAI